MIFFITFIFISFILLSSVFIAIHVLNNPLSCYFMSLCYIITYKGSTISFNHISEIENKIFHYLLIPVIKLWIFRTNCHKSNPFVTKINGPYLYFSIKSSVKFFRIGLKTDLDFKSSIVFP